MNGLPLSFRDQALHVLPSGALWWPEEGLLCVSDLHLGKSERVARRTGAMLPPYETRETLTRLGSDITQTGAAEIICLGDSFDDLVAARDLEAGGIDMLSALMAGRRWIWIEGNHDPGPVEIGGTHLAEVARRGLTFRHIAVPGAAGEVSGHYHPKARLRARGRMLSRRCILVDGDRIILPAYGTYTGGLFCDADPLDRLMSDGAEAILLPGRDQAPLRMPMPRSPRRSGQPPADRRTRRG
ncbi:MAG: ligase-associated DNA damage response endonuclease PdeM [Pseudomonadota bacterium]